MALAHRYKLVFCAGVLAMIEGCTATPPAPQPPSPSADATTAQDGSSSQESSGASDGATSASSAKAPEEPPQSEITNEPPPGGTVTANANPAAAGSDRMTPMFELVKANKDGFRKCFDLWGKKNPGQKGSIAFQFFLKPDGALEKAQMKRDEGDVHAVEVENCMIDFAKTLTYPASTVGKNTIYTHRFEFKAAK
ncbi:MAG: AgmX/PglI C-terminal domain-containing protein [Polyangiaceae bacterium]